MQNDQRQLPFLGSLNLEVLQASQTSLHGDLYFDLMVRESGNQGSEPFMIRVAKASSDETWKKIQNRDAPGRKEFIIARLRWAMRKEHLQDIVNQIGWQGAEVGFLKDPSGNKKDKIGFCNKVY